MANSPASIVGIAGFETRTALDLSADIKVIAKQDLSLRLAPAQAQSIAVRRDSDRGGSEPVSVGPLRECDRPTRKIRAAPA